MISNTMQLVWELHFQLNTIGNQITWLISAPEPQSRFAGLHVQGYLAVCKTKSYDIKADQLNVIKKISAVSNHLLICSTTHKINYDTRIAWLVLKFHQKCLHNNLLSYWCIQLFVSGNKMQKTQQKTHQTNSINFRLMSLLIWKSELFLDFLCWIQICIKSFITHKNVSLFN